MLLHKTYSSGLSQTMFVHVSLSAAGGLMQQHMIWWGIVSVRPSYPVYFIHYSSDDVS